MVATVLQHTKQKMALLLNGKKERVPDGDTLCWLRCGANSGCNATVSARVN